MTTEETEAEEMEEEATTPATPPNTSTVPMATEELGLGESSTVDSMLNTTSVTMTTEEPEEAELEDMTTPALTLSSTSGTGVVTMTTEEPEVTEAPEMEEEEEENVVLPAGQGRQCTQLEGVCLRQCETPTDVITGVTCGNDVMGRPLVCCDD
ncbi:uncharacterized protein LOC143301851 [Babylonia areolata]|uniref:uncharacterized protein LOC143301851 n=1 Tax=Babylonia areolata TaxID=304850 RepID=UPI003FD65420